MERIDEALKLITDTLDQGRNPQADLEAGGAILFLVGTVIKDVHRVADALDKLATPPEMIVSGVSAEDWEAKEKAKDEREGRIASSLERAAKALENLAAQHGAA